MEITSKAKYLKISPQKVRLLAFQFNQKKAQLAVEELNTLPQKSAFLIAKIIKSAMANAENNYNFKKDNLVVERIVVEAGPSYKRMKPRARGGRDIIKKRTAHILVVLSSEEKGAKDTKAVNPQKSVLDKKVEPKIEQKEKKTESVKKEEKLVKAEKKPKAVQKKKEEPVKTEEVEEKPKVKELEKTTTHEKEKKHLKENKPFFQRFFRRKGGA